METRWCINCQKHTPHDREVTSTEVIGCLVSPVWYGVASQLGMTPKNPARCSVCGRVRSRRVVKKRDRPAS